MSSSVEIWVSLGAMACVAVWGRALFNAGRTSHRLWLTETGTLFDDAEYSWRGAFFPWTASSRHLFVDTPSEHRHAAAKAMRYYRLTTIVFVAVAAAFIGTAG